MLQVWPRDASKPADTPPGPGLRQALPAAQALVPAPGWKKLPEAASTGVTQAHLTSGYNH